MATAHVVSNLRTAIGHAQAEALTGRDALGTMPTALRNLTETSAENYNAVHQTILTFKNAALSFVDDAVSVTYGSLEVYDFPRGNLLILGATANLTATNSDGNLASTFGSKFSIGTAAAADDGTLTGTEANLIASVTASAAVASVATWKGKNTAAIAPIDGTTNSGSAQKVFINTLPTYGDTTASGTLKVNGTLTLTWANLGDE